ncbi:MAG: glutaminyl-peptide cyclotransferase [Candidatus Cryptobacteroides sp.]|nr:glutaminyl-peptide cyclotransferase [Bacteroidales bacterium]MDY3963882.1 glutaminyl-peptide cyclotransferase [Candidatus Cryptobacteroides sp.]
MRKFCLALMMILPLLSVSCADARVKQYKLQVVNSFPHDRTSYTQGLFFYAGAMYESTGLNGKSTFRKVDISTGKALSKLTFDRKYFLEGSVEKDGNIYMLTWQNQLAFVYDAATLEYKASYSYPREGWGLTTDGKHLVASDGSARLYFMDDNFRQVSTITVKMDGRPVRYLNELEYIDGKIWANVYMSDLILIINPESGNVEGVVDCTGLLPRQLQYEDTDVLNGIAYNPADGSIYLTGKNWCRLYEVKIVEK